MKRLSILGSTGSIGTQALDVIANSQEDYEVEALAAGSRVEQLAEQIRRFRPKLASVHSKEDAERLRLLTDSSVKIVWGPEGLKEAAAGTEADLVITAVVGSMGLGPTLAAIEAGKDIGLANKETLVSAGHLVTEAAAKRGVRLLPIDSEHSAIFQCLNGEKTEAVRRLIITASGGSFRDRTREQLRGVTVKEALNHPNWSMGAKITIDSATMVNKGLEVIEAHWLFGMDYDRISVLLHAESVIHSMVEFRDNSVMAQLGNPDMRVPIQYALTYPERRPTPTEPLDLTKIGLLHFREMDYERFPLLKLAYDCGRAGGTLPAVFNAANETAVARFLNGEIPFLAIEEIIARTVEGQSREANPGLDELLEADAAARRRAAEIRPEG
ncbi:1-deoxy-D-xylulose-5-phosphate reductoisomerase [Gorillibacterium sp. sgz500922]|uniref:1-deoxy-D-xylulose-5-phosphate reductoisomerase n=1 Tax=Gorillibacterium sp. sgz500922 TaxID=3446694 RepID=UPI003F679D7E